MLMERNGSDARQKIAKSMLEEKEECVLLMEREKPSFKMLRRKLQSLCYSWSGKPQMLRRELPKPSCKRRSLCYPEAEKTNVPKKIAETKL
jgi:hypothetical protein